MGSSIGIKEFRPVVADRVAKVQPLDETTLARLEAEFLAEAEKLPPAERVFVASPSWLHVEILEDPTRPMDPEDLPAYLR